MKLTNLVIGREYQVKLGDNATGKLDLLDAVGTILQEVEGVGPGISFIATDLEATLRHHSTVSLTAGSTMTFEVLISQIIPIVKDGEIVRVSNMTVGQQYTVAGSSEVTGIIYVEDAAGVTIAESEPNKPLVFNATPDVHQIRYVGTLDATTEDKEMYLVIEQTTTETGFSFNDATALTVGADDATATRVTTSSKLTRPKAYLKLENMTREMGVAVKYEAVENFILTVLDANGLKVEISPYGDGAFTGFTPTMYVSAEVDPYYVTVEPNADYPVDVYALTIAAPVFGANYATPLFASETEPLNKTYDPSMYNMFVCLTDLVAGEDYRINVTHPSSFNYYMKDHKDTTIPGTTVTSGINATNVFTATSERAYMFMADVSSSNGAVPLNITVTKL